MRIALRAQHPRNHELRAGEHLPQHPHEGDGAPKPLVSTGLVKEHLRRSIHCVLEPWLQVRHAPARGLHPTREGHPRSVGRVPLQYTLHRTHGLLSVCSGGQADGDNNPGVRPQNIPCVLRRGQPRDARHREARLPGIGQAQLRGEALESTAPLMQPRHVLREDVRPQLIQLLHLLLEVLGDVSMALRDQHFAVHLVLDPRQQLPHDAEGAGHDAAEDPAVDALRQQLHLQLAVDGPPQGRREPHLVIVQCPGVQAEDHIGGPQFGLDLLDPERQVA
mmetsp:Transcript_27363/g.46465  ORF Transcript_27363/g.46465 Transcript_27363/m.46465 type:complete len:277 (+) Transcript_27363:786-1616(+)